MILNSFGALSVIKESLAKYKSKEKPFVIAIDGRCASGKTTFAHMLASELSLSVIHTDSFFLPRSISGEAEQIGVDGNFDIERFYSEAVLGMMSQKPFYIGHFDCKTQKITEAMRFKPSPCFIVEGAYSLNPKLGNYADMKIFFDVDEKTQKDRILKRNGEKGLRAFEQVWIPAEERYFSNYRIKESCDFVVKTIDD